jgi:DNA polymerase III subunit beta
MHISIENKIFINAVHIVARFAERRGATLPALASILILASDDGIKMRATNLEAGIDLKVPGNVVATGAVAVPAALLQQIASSLAPEGSVTLEHAGDILLITSGTGKLSVKTTPYDDFPSIPFPENPKHRLVLPAALLRTVLTSIAGCASISTIRPELASLFLSVEGDTLTAAATDSFRLAEKKIPLATKSARGTFLIPAKNALEIAQALPEEDIIVSFDEHQCAFIASSVMLVSRLTNATYPDYRQIIPKESVAEATVLRKDFETALRRTSIFSDSFQKIKLTLDPKKKQLALFARNPDLGESTETLPAQIVGEGIQLSFNHRYLATMLVLTGTESLSISVAGIGRPLVIRGVGDNSLLYLVSPMNQ